MYVGYGVKLHKKRLLTESNLTLAKAIDVSVSMELAAKEAQKLSSSGKVQRVATENQRQGNQGTCFHCGKVGHKATCWCKDMGCRASGKKGQIELV